MRALSLAFLISSALVSTKVLAQAPAPAQSSAQGSIRQELMPLLERRGAITVEQQLPQVTMRFFRILLVPVCA
jgi:hypothetical protein